ncbi:MAG: hypothetical protein H6814_04205 [Phycisphaeraceae bacterium]|nr:hypothetical protein [Phycisphaeraceae bacterium]
MSPGTKIPILRRFFVPRWGLGAVIGFTLIAPGCATPFQEHRDHIDDLADQGRYGQIVQELESDQARRLYADRDRLLYYLDLGLARFADGDDEGAIGALTTAEAIMDSRFEENAGDVFAKLVLNDTLSAYLGQPYEDIDCNVFKMLAQLEQGVIQGGATVEARRLANKVDLLREQYLTLTNRISGDDRAGGVSLTGAPSVVATAEAGQFIASPLGEFLTAITNMCVGDYPNQAVAARRLRQAIDAQGDLIGAVNPEPFAAIETLRPEDANALAVAFAGPGPRMRALRVGPIPIHDTPIYFELPVLEKPDSETAQVVLVVESEDGTVSESPLHLIEDMARVAQVNHERQLPQIYLRTLLRAAGKSVALTLATQSANRSGKHDGAEIAVLLGGLALLAVTEKADLRCSRLLPGQAYVGLLDLRPGAYRFSYRFLDHRGGLLTETAPVDIEISDRPDGFQTVIEWYWR